MVLNTHAVVGAIIVGVMPNHPVLGTVLAFGSHFVLDTIPHFDYWIYSDSIHPQRGGKFSINKNLIIDFFRIGFDAFLGILIAGLLLRNSVHPWMWLVGAAAGMFPDFLQFIYTRINFKPLTKLQRFHEWVHAKENRNTYFMSTIFPAAILALLIFLIK